jgi:hypothetical protein
MKLYIIRYFKCHHTIVIEVKFVLQKTTIPEQDTRVHVCEKRHGNFEYSKYQLSPSIRDGHKQERCLVFKCKAEMQGMPDKLYTIKECRSF